jgi:hypothetical protein
LRYFESVLAAYRDELWKKHGYLLPPGGEAHQGKRAAKVPPPAGIEPGA